MPPFETEIWMLPQADAPTNATGRHLLSQGAYKATTNSNHSHPIAPNLLMRIFAFRRPDQAWVGDITYIPTGEGWHYLAIVNDLCTRKIVGYAFSERMTHR